MMPTIDLRGVGKSFGLHRILDGVDLSVGRGEIVGLVGPAGSGKSVLFKILAGLIPADTGTVTVAGALVPQTEAELFAHRAGIGLLFQNNALFDFLTVAENVAFPLERRGQTDVAELRRRVDDTLRAVGLDGSGHKLPSELSGGMKKRAALARAVVARPSLCLFDEPTAGLDPVTTSKIYELLRSEQARTGATVLVLSSDVEALVGFAPRLCMLHQGRICYDGPSRLASEASDPVVRQFVNGLQEGPL